MLFHYPPNDLTSWIHAQKTKGFFQNYPLPKKCWEFAKCWELRIAIVKKILLRPACAPFPKWPQGSFRSQWGITLLSQLHQVGHICPLSGCAAHFFMDLQVDISVTNEQTWLAKWVGIRRPCRLKRLKDWCCRPVAGARQKGSGWVFCLSHGGLWLLQGVKLEIWPQTGPERCCVYKNISTFFFFFCRKWWNGFSLGSSRQALHTWEIWWAPCSSGFICSSNSHPCFSAS